MKNGAAKTTSLAPAPDAMIVVLCSVLDSKKASTPSSCTKIFSFVSSVSSSALKSKALALKTPLWNLLYDPKVGDPVGSSVVVLTNKAALTFSAAAPSKFTLASRSGIESKRSETFAEVLII